MCSDSPKNAHGLLATNDHLFCSSTFVSPLQSFIQKLKVIPIRPYMSHGTPKWEMLVKKWYQTLVFSFRCLSCQPYDVYII